MSRLRSFFKIRRIILVSLLLTIVSPIAYLSYRAGTWCYSTTKLYITKRFFTADTITCQFNHFFSDTAQHEIEMFIDHEFANGNLLRFSQGDFYSSIRDKFNLIKSISYRYVPSKTLLVTIEGITPMFMVNHTSLVGENKQLYEASAFENFPTNELPLVMVNPTYLSLTMNEHVFQLLCSLDATFWQSFALNYQGPHEIILQKKESLKNIKIITDHKSLFDQEKFNHITTIQQDLDNKKALSEAQNYELIFDLRFKKRIVTRIVDLGRRGRKKL